MTILCSLRTIRNAVTVIAIIFACSTPEQPRAWAQATRVYGTEDRNIPFPSTSIPLGDSAQAANLLQAYLQAVGAAQWQGVSATGTMTYAGNEAAPEGSATLTITREGSTRLDVTNSKGTTSLRIRGAGGAFQDIKGTRHRLPIVNASAGLFAYPFLLSQASQKTQGLSLAAGTLQLDGRLFNRLSVGRPAAAGSAAAQNSEDIYLSSDTNLPYKSAAFVGSVDGSLQRYLKVITYEDYRQVDGVEIPFRYIETINGQRAWTLQLEEAQPVTTTDESYFTF
jgi:hypothetical protein